MRSLSPFAPRPPVVGRSGPGTSRLFLPVILVAQLMVVLDATIVNVALPHIARGLRFSPSSLSWVLNAYILAFGGALLLGARAGDLVGRRRTFLVGVALFSASSLAGGLAPTAWMLLVARVAQGLGAALAAPSALALLTSAVPDGPRRVRAIGLFTAVSAAGGAIGLVAGGLLTQWASWRWVMFVNVPIGLAVLVAGRTVLSEGARRHGRLDVVGALTSTLGMTGLVLALVEAGTSGWTAPSTLVPAVVGVALLATFVRTERRAEEPVLPLRLLTDPARSAANAARGLVYAGMYGMFFFLSQFLQAADRYSPVAAGVAFLPVPVSLFAASQLTTRVLSARVRAKVLMGGGIVTAALGLLLAARLQVGSGYPAILVVLVVLGVGCGVSLVSLTSAALAGVAPGDAGAAAGLTNAAQQVGAALGLAVLVTVFSTLSGHARITDGLGAAHQAVLVRGLHGVFLVGAAFAASAFVLVAALVRPALRPRTTVEDLGGADEAEVLSAA